MCSYRSEKKICFVSPFAYPLLSKNSGSTGGAERQFVLFGRELIKRGWRATFITDKSINQKLNEETIMPVYNASFSYMGGPKWQLIPNWISLWSAMKKADANYYVLKNPGHILPLLGLFCKLNKRKLIFWSQTSRDALIYRKGVSPLISRLHDIGLRMVEVVIAQTEEQRRNYETNYGIKAAIVPSICENLLPDTRKDEKNDTEKDVDILWAGNSTYNKRQEVIIELAKLLPNRKFAIAMNLSDKKRFERASNEAQKLHNVIFLGTVPPFEMEKWFSKTKLLVTTSIIEGFPNTFLQAWMNEIPVISLNIDPDDIIKKFKLGFVLTNINKIMEISLNHTELAALFIEPIERLLNDKVLRNEMGKRGSEYVAKIHSPEVTIPQFIKALSN